MSRGSKRRTAIRRLRVAAFAVAAVVGASACEAVTSIDRSRIPGDDDAAALLEASANDGASMPSIDGGATPDGASQVVCPSPVDAAALAGWRPPKHTFAACSQAELSAIAPQLSATPTPWSTIYSAVSPTCQACLFSAAADPTWQPIVWHPDMAAGEASFNVGACLTLAKGGSAACGAAGYVQNACVAQACSGTCAARSTCQQSAVEGVCADVTSSENSACGPSANAAVLYNQCQLPRDQINMVCGDTYVGDYDAGPGCDAVFSCAAFHGTYPMSCLPPTIDPIALSRAADMFCVAHFMGGSGGCLVPHAELTDGSASFVCVTTAA